MLSLLHVQIIIEVVFFAAILLMLWQLKRNIDKYRPLADGSAIEDLKKMINDSQVFADGFLSVLEANKQALNKMLHEIDAKQRQLVMLRDEADAAIKKFAAERAESEPYGSAMSYDEVINMLQHGKTREEVSKKTGLSEDEINLVMELVRTGTRRPRT